MTAETFTESVQPVIPMPDDIEEAIGWVVEADAIAGGTIRGTVRATTFSRLEIQWDGECGRKCCLESVKFEDVDFIEPEPCDCGSGQAAVLCLCREDESEEEVAAWEA